MASDAVELADSLVFTVTGRHLSDLQLTILRQVWQGRKYLDIAHKAGYTEGHVKDVASQLWKILSKVTGERITKATLKSALERYYCQSVQCGSAVNAFSGSQALKSQPSTLTATFESWQGRSAPDPGPSNATAGQPLRGVEPGWNTHFVGRQPALADLQQLIGQGHRAVVIQGEGGLGKTTLAQHFVAQQQTPITLELLMAKDPADITPVEWVVEEWLRQDFGVEPGREFGVTLDRLKRHLRKQPVVILIDNLEPCLDGQGRFIPTHRRYQELLRVLTDVRNQAVTILTSRDRICEPGISLTHYRLPGLDVAAWGIYFAQQGIALNPSVLGYMHSAYGGNAKAMEILGGVIQSDFEGDMTAYWQLYGADLLSPVDLKNLVESQIKRLKALDFKAYTVFCRLGVFRFQDVPTLDIHGLLCLMNDLPQNQHQAIVNSLRNRCLLECRQGRYWLHPVVREGAIAQLRAQANGEAQRQKAHRDAAQYWTHSIRRIHTIDDALQALEAYYHYAAIRDWESAAQVILHSRDNQWGQFLPLGSSLYRMGRVQPVTDAITTVIDHIPSHSSDASELSNILGDLCWIQGRIQDAIACQESAIAIAQNCLQSGDTPVSSHRSYYLSMLLVDSQLSLGLYHLDLWELEEAATWFRQVIDTASGTRHQRWSEKATVCLALVQSCQGEVQSAQVLADSIAQQVSRGDASGRYAFFAQLLGHTYVNLGNYAQARTLFEAATTAADAGHYLQIKANALSGLGRLESRLNQMELALAYHREAITLLEEVGAQCDLATAHLHLAITLMNQGNQPAAREEFQTALKIFSTIPAPQQVARVNRCQNI